MQGGKNRQPLGYTIIEVLIVLAISASMFLIAANFINGKQERASFFEGVNTLASSIQNTLDQVTNGHYSDINLYCRDGTPVSFMGTAQGQGTNQDCVFLGKIMHFYKNGTKFPQQYETFSLAASRTDLTKPPNNLSIAAISQFHLTTQSTIPQNLEIHNFTVNGNPSVYNVGFAQGLGSADILIPDATPQSGSQSIGLIYADNLDDSNSKDGSEGSIYGTHVRPATSATICVSDGRRAANILVGNAAAASSQLAVKVQQLGVNKKCPTP